MKPIESALEPIVAYLISMTRDTKKGWYFLTVGIPKGWVFTENNEISCKIVEKLEEGNIIEIAPNNVNIVVDDLVDFVEIIIETNEKIAQKEQEFTNEMQEMKRMLEEKAKRFYEELDELKDNSFKKNSDEFVKTLQSQKDEKRRVGRPKKEDSTAEQTTTHATE